VVTHRYLGVALGGLMLLWCLSGAVMLFAPYPSVSKGERLAALPRIDWSRCCRINGLPANTPVTAAAVEQLAGAPVLRLRTADGGRQVIDLATGEAAGPVTRDQALAVAADWGRPAGATAVLRDQWTVSGEFNWARPFWRVRLAGPGGVDVYVSQATGEVAQRTTAASRALAWIGAAPHWLYPTMLRQDTRLWTQVVVWTSLAGTFLTLAGLWLGVLAWRRSRDGRLSPFRGVGAWHHLGGLFAGVLTLTWVASGLVSMNPWGFLESAGDGGARARIAGPPVPLSAVEGAIDALQRAAAPAASVRLAPLDGRVFLLAGDARVDAEGHAAPLAEADLAAAGRRAGAVAEQGMITDEDAYYFSHHQTVALPVWRVVLADGRRFYLDPRSGETLASVDAPGRGFRWLHEGLHRFDFVPGLRSGPGWAAAVLILLAAASFGVATGTWLGLRRLIHDLASLARRRRVSQ
jgi:hypothetical protein